MKDKYEYLSEDKRIKQSECKPTRFNNFRLQYKYTLQNRYLVKTFWGKKYIWADSEYTYGEWAHDNRPVFRSFDELKNYLLEKEKSRSILATPLLK